MEFLCQYTLEELIKGFEEGNLKTSEIEKGHPGGDFSSELLNKYLEVIGGEMCAVTGIHPDFPESSLFYVSYYMSLILARKNRDLEDRVYNLEGDLEALRDTVYNS